MKAKIDEASVRFGSVGFTDDDSEQLWAASIRRVSWLFG